MKQVSSGYKNAIKTYGKQIDSIITYTLFGTERTLGKADLNSVAINYDGSLLKSVMKELKIDSNTNIPNDTVINYKFGVLVGNNYEYVDYGNFIVKEKKRKADTNSYEITCYDKMLYAMRDYEDLGVEYPITIRSYINAICNKLGLTFANANGTFANYDKEIQKEPYLKEDGSSLGYTFRDTLDELAQVTASTICINNNDELEIRYITAETPTPTRPSKNIVDTQGFQNGYINTSGTFVSDNKTALLNYHIPVEAGKTYCFSTNATVDNMVISMFGSSDNFLRRQKVTNTNKVTQEMASDVAYVRYAVNYNNSSTMTQEIIDNLEIMGEEGENRTIPYEPYGPVEMGKNILNVPSELSLSVSEDEVIVPLNIEEDGEYTISIESKTGTQGAYFLFVDENDEEVVMEYLKNNRKARTVELTTSVVKVYIYPENGSCVLTNTMLEKGTTRTVPYEPYIEPQDIETIDEKSLKDINVEFGEKYGPINSIVFTRAGGSDSIYLSDNESIEENGLCEIKIVDNQILNGNDRDEFLGDILETLDGLEYYINDYSSTGITYLDLCDRYNVQIGENTYSCVMFNDEINITQGLEETIHTDMPENGETDYSKSDKTDRKIDQTYVIADKQKGEIEALTSRVTTTEDELRNVYTIDQVNTLIQNAKTGVTNTFSEAGGNNIFRNTGLWFDTNDENNPYEFWNGNVVRVSEDRASNRNALMLQNTTLTQTQTAPNGNYTISFKYKKLKPLSTVSCTINGVDYELTEESETEFVQTILVNAQSIQVDFDSNVDDACEIYDLMVNAGQVRLAYSQNQNETTTDTVNISKGITITSSDYNTTFKANADGIRTLDNGGGELAKFTDKGMTTKEMIVENKAQVTGLLFQQIGDQVWISKL